MALTVKCTAIVNTTIIISFGVITERLHPNACHIDVVHELCLYRVVIIKEKGAICNELLGSGDEVVAIIIHFRHNVGKSLCYLVVHCCGRIQSLLRTVSSVSEC